MFYQNTLTVKDLDLGEQTVLNKCIDTIRMHGTYNTRCADFYDASKRISNLGIALPKLINSVKVATSWASLIVDSLEERLNILGFSIPGKTIPKINEIWEENHLDREYSQAHLEALIHGVSFLAVSRGGKGDPDPVVTVESPFNTTGIYDPVRRNLSYACVTRPDEENNIVGATLYTRDEIIQIERVRENVYEIANRDTHNLGKVLVERMVNRPRRSKIWGASEITPSVQYYTLASMRTLCRSEIASELFAAPQRYILGVDENMFEQEGATNEAIYRAYLGQLMVFPDDNQDPDYKRPELGEFKPSAPTPFIDQIKAYAQLLAGEAALPPQYLGFHSENPASADQIRAVEARHVKKAERRQTWFGDAWVSTMKNAYALTGGDVADLKGLCVNWADASTPTRAATTDAVVKQVQAGIVPPTSSVILEQLGYDKNSIDRIQLEHVFGALSNQNKDKNETVEENSNE